MSGLVGVSTSTLPPPTQGCWNLLLRPCLYLSIIQAVVFSRWGLVKKAGSEGQVLGNRDEQPCPQGGSVPVMRV